jgi:hypothetical protein
MNAPFWTAEKDRLLRRLKAKGLTARQIGDQLGTTRNAVIGRSARLSGVVFPSQIRRAKEEQALRRERLQRKKERNDAALAVMRRAMAKGIDRDAAIVSAVQAHATYQAIGDELGMTRQRVQQIIAARIGRRRR